MAIQSLIYHKISRWQEDQPATLRLREQKNQVGADDEGLFAQLKKLFQFRPGKYYGVFSDDHSQFPFASYLNEAYNNKISFEQFATLYMQHLKELCDKTSESFELYPIILMEERADGPRCYIFLLENQAGLQLDRSLSLDTLEFLNTSKLEFAMRIDLDDWKNAEAGTPYLTMIRGRGQAKLGEAFTQSIGFQNSIDTKQETETLMEVLAAYTKDNDVKDAANIRQKAYDFCVEQQQLGEPVPLNDLSVCLNEQQPNNFAEFAQAQEQVKLNEQIRPDTRKLKHLVRLSGKGNGLSLSFSSDLIQQTILFDEQSDTITITAIPKSLKKQLLEHLQESQSSEK
jgi:nucleoid-associated protein